MTTLRIFKHPTDPDRIIAVLAVRADFDKQGEFERSALPADPAEARAYLTQALTPAEPPYQIPGPDGAFIDPPPAEMELDESLDQEGVAQSAATGARAWYETHPNAALLFELSIDDLELQIDSLDLTALPAATRNSLKLLLKTLSVAVRVLAKREGFVE